MFEELDYNHSSRRLCYRSTKKTFCESISKRR